MCTVLVSSCAFLVLSVGLFVVFSMYHCVLWDWDPIQKAPIGKGTSDQGGVSKSLINVFYDLNYL